MFKNMNHKKMKLVLVIGVAALMVAGVLTTSGKPVASQEEKPSAWIKRCNEEGPQKGYCEIFQRLIVQETGQRVAEFAVGYPQDTDGARGVIILPLAILLPDGGSLKIDDGQAFNFKVRYCLNDGCYAFLNMNDSVLDMMRKGDQATLSFKLLEGKEISLPFPLTGFTKSIKEIS